MADYYNDFDQGAAAAAEAISIAREVMIETGIWDALRAAYGPEAAE